LKFVDGVKGAITINKGLVHLNKKPQNGLETPGKGWRGKTLCTQSPLKVIGHKYNFSAITFLGNVWTSHLGLFLFVLSIFD
jgi:hypothetical protein